MRDTPVTPARLAALAAALALTPSAFVHDAVSGDDGTRQVIQSRVARASRGLEIVVGDDPVHADSALARFYSGRQGAPAWSDGERVAASVADLISAIRDAGRAGMVPRRYHVPAIEALVARVGADPVDDGELPRLLADLDLLCTDAFLTHARHLADGVVNPEAIDPDWHAKEPDIDVERLLESALRTRSVRVALHGLAPTAPAYARLQESLAEYRSLADRGGWPPVTPGKKLEPGCVDGRVRELRETLTATGDLPRAQAIDDTVARTGAEATSPDVYDEELQAAVVRFQTRHGLDPDAIVGKATLRALNATARQRVRQIEANLERWRWLPRDLGDRYVMVNVPGFSATVVEGDSTILEMKVIVGQRYRRTPAFSARMSYLVLCPYWEVPPRLAVEDKLPEILEDPSYLTRQGIRVLKGWGDQTREVDPATVPWDSLDQENFPYRLRQDPGPLNALGRVKFMFPNQHQVYLHDTPSRSLFVRASRTFSSGCIRVEKALDLAVYLLADQPRWTRAEIEKAIEAGSTTTVPVTRRVRVHILYWTAWTGEDGVVHFREDIYDRDRLLHEALVTASEIRKS